MASSLTTSGLGSGLDVTGLVAKLVAAERGAADARLLKEDKNLTADLTSISKLKGALSTLKTSAAALQDTTSLIQRLTNSSDYSIFAATADSTAVTGSYDIEVTQLATAARQTSVALGSAYSTDVETGTVTITQGSTSFNVTVDSSNNTLSGLRDAINLAAGSSGVTATLLTTSEGVRLQVSGGSTGAANALSFSTSNASGAGTVRLTDLFVDRRASGSYASSTQQLQAGSVTLAQAGSPSFTVNLNGGSRTLQDFVDAVNAAPGNPGIKARLQSVAGGNVQVVLNGAPGSTGSAITMSQTPSGGGGYDIALADFVAGFSSQTVQKSAAADAMVKIDGLSVSSTTNSIQNAIQGVTMTLTKVSAAGVASKLTVTNNDTGVKNKVNEFVTAYNQLAATMNALGGYEPVTKTAGAMLGDALLLSIQSQVRKTLGTSSANGSSTYTTLASLGIVSKTDGQLAVDDTKLTAALKADSRAASFVFSGGTGVAAAFSSVLEKRLATGGDISARESVIALQRKDLDKRKVALDARMVDFQARQLKIFNSLDGMLSKMQTTASQLAQSLAKASSG